MSQLTRHEGGWSVRLTDEEWLHFLCVRFMCICVIASIILYIRGCVPRSVCPSVIWFRQPISPVDFHLMRTHRFPPFFTYQLDQPCYWPTKPLLLPTATPFCFHYFSLLLPTHVWHPSLIFLARREPPLLL